MTYDTTGYLQAEIEYRAQRAYDGTRRGGRRRHPRFPLGRRPLASNR